MATIVTRAGKGSALTHSEMDANWNNLNDDTDQFAKGGVTKLAFFQAAAPTGWTQDVTNTDAMLRVVSTAGGGTGGTASPTTGLTATNSHQLTIAEMPAHSHDVEVILGAGGNLTVTHNNALLTQNIVDAAQPTGGDTAHTHNITWAPKFVDMIVCSKD